MLPPLWRCPLSAFLATPSPDKVLFPWVSRFRRGSHPSGGEILTLSNLVVSPFLSRRRLDGSPRLGKPANRQATFTTSCVADLAGRLGCSTQVSPHSPKKSSQYLIQVLGQRCREKKKMFNFAALCCGLMHGPCSHLPFADPACNRRSLPATANQPIHSQARCLPAPKLFNCNGLQRTKPSMPYFQVLCWKLPERDCIELSPRAGRCCQSDAAAVTFCISRS